jgi:DNA mismatch repair ATPase MutL
MTEMKAISQVENKVIMAICGEFLVALDQHAVDERIHLEELEDQHGVYKADFVGCKLLWTISLDKLASLKSQELKMKRLGWDFVLRVPTNDKNFLINVSKIPKFLNEEILAQEDFENCLAELEKFKGTVILISPAQAHYFLHHLSQESKNLKLAEAA